MLVCISQPISMAFAATAKIAPPIDTRYGGYCAFGVAMGKKFETEPKAGKIENGKLYLNLDKTVQNPWWENTQKFIRDANENGLTIKTVAADKL